MGRYILRYLGEGLRPEAEMQRIRTAPGLTVLDESARLLLVQASAELLENLLSSLPGWTWSPERTIRLPDARPRPRRRPKPGSPPAD